MRFSSFNHVQLLRYAGLFTWACVGIPLLRRYWQSEDGYTAIEIAGWWLSYLAFGLSYWLITRDLGKRYHWLLQLPMLAVLNAAIDESRRAVRREVPTDTLPDLPTSPGLGVEERDSLVAALQALPAQQRAAVLLRHWLGLPVAEVAAELGISEGTVKSHTSRGLQALRGRLEETEPA